MLGIATKPRSYRAALTLTLVAVLCVLGAPAASSEQARRPGRPAPLSR